MARKSASRAILEQMADERRLVLSDWRAMIYLRRASFALRPQERRWTKMPADPEEMWPILRRMSTREEMQPLSEALHLYRAAVPYARDQPVEEEEVLMEVHPYASLGYLSALFFHGFTEAMPRFVVALAPADGKGGLLPLDTTTDDWEGVELVKGYKAAFLLESPARWRSVKPERYFGFEIYRRGGYPVRVTTPERTLVDGLVDPELSGGMENVLRAWAMAQDGIDADSVVYQVERLGVGVLRQRVGYVMEELGLSHPSLEEWRRASGRGGSSRLLASAPYSPSYDERWNLSINAPVVALRDAV